MGWQDGWDWGQTIGAGAIGAITGGIGGYIGAIGRGVCFTAGTLVWTQTGRKPIEEVQAGDWVCSKDERTGAVSYQRVKRTFRRVSEKIVMVKAGKETIQTTPEHPFWVAGKGWVAAKELAKGDRLITPDEKVAVVGEARVEAVRGPPAAVYNLEVENTHTYFVGRSGVWVHNACSKPDFIVTPNGTAMPTNQDFDVFKPGADITDPDKWFSIHNTHPHGGMSPHTHYPQIDINPTTGVGRTTRMTRPTVADDIDLIDERLRSGEWMWR
jgi:hypothetical protein